MQVLIFIFSLIMVYYGAESTIKGAKGMGKVFKLSPMVIGLFILSIGTSLPELFVGHVAFWRGEPQIAIGNVLGSNIANLFLVFGVSLLIVPFSLHYASYFFIHLRLHFLLTLIFAVILSSGVFASWGALSLVVFFFFYLKAIYHEMTRKISHHVTPEIEEQHLQRFANKEKLKYLAFLIFGLAILSLGSELLVNSTSSIARLLGVSEYVISVVLIAVGTSFPEIVLTLSILKKKMNLDFVIGNIIGSNIFNIGFVFLSFLFYAPSFDRHMRVEGAALVLASAFLWYIAWRNRSISKFTGTVFLLTYLALVAYWFQ